MYRTTVDIISADDFIMARQMCLNQLIHLKLLYVFTLFAFFFLFFFDYFCQRKKNLICCMLMPVIVSPQRRLRNTKVVHMDILFITLMPLTILSRDGIPSWRA